MFRIISASAVVTTPTFNTKLANFFSTDKLSYTETIYLSVLGDVTGDGRISAVDVTYLRQIANDKDVYDNLSVEKKLASLVLNVGIVTTADAEIIRNIMDNKITIDLFY